LYQCLYKSKFLIDSWINVYEMIFSVAIVYCNEVVNMKKDIVYVMFANIINLLINLIANFMLPKYLSVESYAMIKTYVLYI